MTNKNLNDDPVSISIKPKIQSITRINRLPVVLICFVFLGVVIFLIFNMSHKQTLSKQKAKDKSEEAKAVSSTQPVQEKWFKDPSYDNIRLSQSDANSIPSEVTSLKTQGFASLAIENDFNQTKKTDVSTVSLQKISLESQKSLQEAVKSVGIASDSDFDSGSTKNGYDQSSSYIREGSNYSGTLSKEERVLDDKERFLKEGVLPGDYLPHLLKGVISKFEVKAGTVIPAALEGGLNSDLPGYLRARVRENVYDTVTGKYLLIPQGAMLLGEYQSKVEFGQNRVLVVWTRMIYPNGKSINLEKMSGVDRSGYSGLSDRTNNHWLRLYSSALLMSVMGAGYEVLQKDGNNNEEESISQSVASAVGQQLGQVSNEMIRKNLNVSPTLEIRPGHKFNVFVQKDMLLEPWGEYEPL